MQQPRKCGCGSIKTPTLAELLAVARSKPLPTIRERRPPPVKVGASLKGWVEWRLIDRAGREVRGGEGPNLITDQGLNQIATQELKALSQSSGTPVGGWFPIIGYCAVGTDNIAPSVSDTALGTEVGRTSTTYQSNTISRTTDGVYEITRYMEFDYDEANGNLTEWGFSYDATGPGLLFNRALFLDGGGTPEVVTKSSDYKLRIIYTLEVTLSPVTFTAGSFSITGVGTVNGDYTLIGGTASSSLSEPRDHPDLHLFSALARGDLGTVAFAGVLQDLAGIRAEEDDLSSLVYTTQLAQGGDSVDRQVAREVSVERDAYVPGSFERTGGLWKWDTGYGNLDPIKGFIIAGYPSSSFGGRAAYAFDLDLADEFTKDNEHTLTIGAPTVSWGRGS